MPISINLIVEASAYNLKNILDPKILIWQYIAGAISTAVSIWKIVIRIGDQYCPQKAFYTFLVHENQSESGAKAWQN